MDKQAVFCRLLSLFDFLAIKICYIVEIMIIGIILVDKLIEFGIKGLIAS